MKYIIQMKAFNGNYDFFETDEDDAINEAYTVFKKNEALEQISVYEELDKNYCLIGSEHKRRIGF